MSRLGLPLLFLVLLALPGAAQKEPPVTLKPQDVLQVFVVGEEAYTGEYPVLSDGSITGYGFGRLKVGDKTLEEARRLIVGELKKRLKNPEVTVFLKKQHVEQVFVVGMRTRTGGAVQFVPGLSLRQVLAEIDAPEGLDLLEGSVYRNGKSIGKVDIGALLRSDGGQEDVALQANDVVTLLPKDFVRVWILGAVLRPGEVRLEGGANPYQAIAAAGGVLGQQNATAFREVADEDFTLSVRRGGQTFTLPFRMDPGAKPLELMSGDTVILQQSPRIRVSVSGSVMQPGDYVLRKPATIEGVLALAGGLRAEGSRHSVSVVRRNQAYSIDASQIAGGGVGIGFELQDGDMVFVRKSERMVYAFGTVNRPGRIYLDDARQYRLADVLAQADGLAPTGTLRRVYVGKPKPAGGYDVRMYNLDEFVKGGRLESNPSIEPGDVVMFGTPRGVTLRDLSQALSSLVLVETLLRRR